MQANHSDLKSTRRTSWLLAAAVTGMSTLFGTDGSAATPEAGKAPQRIADKDWKIQIVPGPAIGPSPVPAYNAAARRAMSKLTAKRQQAEEAAKTVVPETPAPAKVNAPQDNSRSETEPAPAETKTAEAQPMPLIIPEQPEPAAGKPVIMANCDPTTARPIDPGAYSLIYNSIPFSRAEYFANPSYRHEATMEILLGQMRPTTVMKMTVPMTQTTHGFANPIRTESYIRQDVRHHYSHPPYYYHPYAY